MQENNFCKNKPQRVLIAPSPAKNHGHRRDIQIQLGGKSRRNTEDLVPSCLLELRAREILSQNFRKVLARETFQLRRPYVAALTSLLGTEKLTPK